MAMVIRANKESSELGGHIASYQSLATLYEVGFNHFWRAPVGGIPGRPRLLPGPLLARQLRARVPRGPAERATQLDGFRQEVSRDGLSSYPHPWLMPDFWQFPTVSLGIGGDHLDLPGAVHEVPPGPGAGRDGGAQGVGVPRRRGDGRARVDGGDRAGRPRGLDNLIWVVNCNLQRLDGPVRGNGKIIQELESDFRGAGWNVIKVIWGSRWDPLLAADVDGRLVRVMEECVDGDYQTFKSRDGAYVREHFFGRDPVLLERVRAHVRRGHLAAQPRRPRPAEGLRRLSRGRGSHRASRR